MPENCFIVVIKTNRYGHFGRLQAFKAGLWKSRYVYRTIKTLNIRTRRPNTSYQLAISTVDRDDYCGIEL